MGVEKYKVLIADDEYWIRDNLEKMLKECRFDFTVLKSAVDGFDAVKKAEERKPDIILTDINMPGVNGIQLIQTLKDKNPGIEIIVISGYQDFEYVRDALVYGAIDYLLKPINQSALENVLDKALKKITIKNQNNLLNSTRQKEMMEYSSYIQDQKYSLMISHYDSFAVIEEQISEMELDYVGYCLILITLNGFTQMRRTYEDGELNEEIYRVKEFIRKKLSGKRGIVFHNIYVSDEFIIICDAPQNDMYQLGVKLTKELSVREKCYCTIGVSEYAFSLCKIKEIYLTAKVSLLSKEYRNYNYTGKVEDGEKLESKRRVMPEQERNLKEAVTTRNRQEIISILNDINLLECGEKKWTFLEVKQTVNKIAWILLEDEENIRNLQNKIEMEYLFEYLNMVLENYNIHKVYQVILEMIDKLLEQNQEVQEESESVQNIVIQCCEYIKGHYYENLSLAGLADKYHISAPYFSKAFKQVTGENLMTYIARIRIDKAVEYIQQGVPLTDIAGRVGYDDYSYFNRVFRKLMQQGPRQYKTTFYEKKKS